MLTSNQQIFRLLVRIRERRGALASLVRQCLPNLPGDKLLFGGCYLAGTGEDSETEQAFAPGVFARLIEMQDEVSWTDDALREDASFLRLAATLKTILSLVIAALVVSILGLIGYRFWNGAGTQDPGT